MSPDSPRLARTLSEPDPINYQRLYEYRLRSVDQESRQAVWGEIASFIHSRMGSPERVLCPAAGRAEFANALPGVERWVVDTVAYNEATLDPEVKSLVGSALDVELPLGYFDGVFVSNFLEHLATPQEVATFLRHIRGAMEPGGVVAVLGPNFRCTAKSYFDCADHLLALTEVSVSEHLYAAGFEVRSVVPRLLPYSFRGVLPARASLTRAYLRFPPAWRVLGKQYLVMGELGAAT